MSKSILILISGMCLLTSACHKLKNPGATSAVKVANEWWVTFDSVGIRDYYGIGHLKIATYNNAANDSTIWVDDNQSLSSYLPFSFKVKCMVNYQTLSFYGTPNAANAYYSLDTTSFPKVVGLTQGKIFLKAAHSKSGNVVDSIHIRLEFSNDPGTIYEMNGVERTRFIEDDY